jgi:hypothetical protein
MNSNSYCFRKDKKVSEKGSIFYKFDGILPICKRFFFSGHKNAQAGSGSGSVRNIYESGTQA